MLVRTAAILGDRLRLRWYTRCIGASDEHERGYGPRFEPFDDPELEAAIDAACPGDSINSPCLSIPDGCADPRG